MTPPKHAPQPISKLIFKFSMVVLMSYMLFNMVIGFYFVFFPVIKRSAEDFAYLIHENVVLWKSSTAEKKQALSLNLLKSQNIILSSEPDNTATKKETSFLPYIYLLKKSLEQQKHTVKIDFFPANKFQYVITLNNNPPVYIQFQKSRIGTSPPYVIFSIFLSSILISILASYVLAHQLDRYFQPLINALLKLSKGEAIEPVEEKGPAEIQLLSKNFNDMSHDVHQLLQNRTTLLTGVSHNLRTPVARIKLGLELLPDSTDPELKDKINRSLDDIDNTITQFLKMAEGMNTLTPQICDLNMTIRNLIAGFENCSVDIIFNPEFELTYNLSITALEQILLNLIENSLRYAQNTPINIVTQITGKQLQIKVIDQGPGIPEEIKEHIFQPFVSLQTPGSNIPGGALGGTGLGLAICNIMTKAHRWELTLNSAPTGGTCACLTIPVPSFISP